MRREHAFDYVLLVERLNTDTSPNRKRSKKALGELKGLVQKAPTAVVASRGAVPAILREVDRLAQACAQDDEHADECTEPLQDALEALGLLVGDGAGIGSPKN